MKQFFINLWHCLYIPHPAAIHMQTRRLLASKSKPEAAVNVAESKKQLRKRRLLEMYKATGLTYTTSSAMAIKFGITIPELVDYYHYFGHLPKDDYLIILRNYGVQALISECQTLIEL